MTEYKESTKHEDKMTDQNKAIQYLRAFGYLKDMSPTSHTLDEPVNDNNILRAAILDFQNMAQLPRTGEIDATTITKMRQPRCGVPDVGNETLSEEFVLTGTIWDHAIVTYRIENFSPDMDIDKQREIIQIGFKRWADVVPLIFREVKDGEVDIRIRFAAGDHGDGFPFDGSPSWPKENILAHAFFPPSNRAGALAGDVHYDEAEVWLDGRGGNGYDLLTVTVHELGHSLGLRHTSIPYSTMNPFYPTPNVPQADDREGIRTAYREHIWIASIYRDLLHRRFEEQGLDYWVRKRFNGLQPVDVVRGFSFSKEYSEILAKELYHILLDRAPAPNHLSNWTVALSNGMSRQSAIIGFLTSDEYLNNNPIPNAFVDSLYRRLLRRSPDPKGFNDWINVFKSGGTPIQVADGFLRSEEFARRYVRSFYNKYLRREPDNEGWNKWSNAISEGLAHQDLIAGFIASDEYRNANVRWW